MHVSVGLENCALGVDQEHRRNGNGMFFLARPLFQVNAKALIALVGFLIDTQSHPLGIQRNQLGVRQHRKGNIVVGLQGQRRFRLVDTDQHRLYPQCGKVFGADR